MEGSFNLSMNDPINQAMCGICGTTWYQGTGALSCPKCLQRLTASEVVESTIAERGAVYGDPYDSHVNIGLSWTGLLQQHYDIKLSHPIPASLVAQLMIALKNQRSARVYKDDNYIDLKAYTKFAEEFQKREQQPPHE